MAAAVSRESPLPATARLPLHVVVTPGMGGAGAWAVRLRQRLAGSREVSLICRGDAARMAIEPDFAYRRTRDLGRWLMSAGPGIIMPNWVWSIYPLTSVLRARGLILPTVAYCRSDSEDHYYRHLRTHRAHIDWIVAVSKECEAGVRTALPEMAAYTVHLPTFVERRQQLERAYMPTGQIRLAYTGRLETEDKRVLDLLDLAQQLLDRGVDFSLTFIGSGSKTETLLARMSRTRHLGRIRLVGEVAPWDVPRLLEDVDVFVQASETEGLSNSLIEAMAAGVVPVVTNASSGVDGIVIDGVTGYTAEVGDIAAMADRVESLASDMAKLAELGAQAHARTEEFTWPSYSERLERFLRRVEDRAIEHQT